MVLARWRRTSAGTNAPAGVLQTLRETPLSAHVVLLGIFINQVGAFVQLFLVLFLTARGFTVGQAGLALGCYSVGAIAGTFGGGALADWLGPRLTIVLSMGAAGLFTFSLTLLHNLPVIYVAAALSGAMARSSATASSTLLFELVPRDRQVMMQAMYRTVNNGGLAVAPLVGAAVSTVSWDLVFWADAGTSLVYCGIAAFVLRSAQLVKDTEKATGQPAAARPARTSYLDILRDRRYLVYLVLMLCNGLVHIQFFAVLPLMLKAEHYPTWAYASLTAVSATLGVILQLSVTRRTQAWPIWLAVMGGWTLLWIGRGSFGLPGGLIVLFIAMLIGCAGQLIGGPAAFAHPVRVAPPGAKARYIGMANGAFQLGYAIGPVAGVLLWTHIGKGIWLICAILGAVITLPGIWSLMQDKPAVQAAVATGAAEATGVVGAAGGAAELESAGPESAEMPPPDMPLSDADIPDGVERGGVTRAAPSSAESSS
jgi:MFS family permease